MITMRALWVAILVAGLLAGCGGGYTAQRPSPVATVCANPYSGQSATHLDVQLMVRDNSRKVTAHLCDWIVVLLVGPPSSQWQTVQSSDDAILKVVPLPLHAPPPGGTNLVYEAERTGSAVLSSVGPSSTCANQAAVCAIVRWAVTVTVVT
jgi:hypothetical protein